MTRFEKLHIRLTENLHPCCVNFRMTPMHMQDMQVPHQEEVITV
jgi:hypothetical protein